MSDLIEVVVGLIVFACILGFVGGIVYGLMCLNFVQLNELNKKTCDIAGIPKENCFCEMDVGGNVLCSQKQQSSYSISTSTTIIRSD